MSNKVHSSRRYRIANVTAAAISLALLTLGCLTGGMVDEQATGIDVADLAGKSYFAAETTTPIPTVTVFLGTSTPVYPPTPIPGVLTIPPVWITSVPGWATVTATSNPPWAIPTWTVPYWPTATDYWVTTAPGWVTTTPEYITETPVPPWTTTPALPIYGFTTPVPLETPYYRVGTFYLNQDVYVGRPDGLVFNVQGHTSQPSPHNSKATYHYIELVIKNYTGQDNVVIPLTDIFFVREVNQNGERINGRWGIANEPMNEAGLPLVSESQMTPLADGEVRTITIGFITPNGTVDYIGMVTDWARPIAGGVPIWFYLQQDPGPDAPYVNAYKPPPPTPIIFDDNNTYNGGVVNGGTPPPPGIGSWPTSGSIFRGFGCDAFFTGVSGAGWGCPTDKPWFHTGVDIANTTGTAIFTPIDGTMVFAGPDLTGADCSGMSGSQAPHTGYGNYQKIQGAGLLQYFAHLSSFAVMGGSVTKGTQISAMGSTGCSTGSHLHWMIYQSGNLIDPAWWAGPGPPS